MTRLFIAAEIPADVQTFVEQHARSSVKGCPQLQNTRILPADSLHITLKFLGDTCDTAIDGILAAIESAAKDFGPVKLETGRICVLTPFVVAMGIRDSAGRLKRLQGTLEAKLEALGFPPEPRHFRPHITVARSRGRRRLPLSIVFPNFKEISFCVSAVSLMKSSLTPGGAVYSPVRRFALES